MIEDLEETFESLRKVNLRLNPEKCVFGVPSGKLLGFLISHRGIEANPEKIKAIEDMSPPQTLKEMHKLAGRVTVLGRDTSPTYLLFLIVPCYIILCFGHYWDLLYTFILFWD